ncbi:efflux RND transporter periplasmic adaptor subunit [Microbulbifer sp. OS29]|uniref:Efflux RND transporter periplasmic adaptor subunit n=1 Tax=Microbulbifer okhotskensis TaxID=2926617 RepID=A0A9X2J558_9GAMM|nr:efflux RND transporter periplasmic adaptor subunit [Microbulbifer okhotskensis]MCO1333240.1 efflux RND transporter periplasmic adaptor subunit [Microbulbifer okhotskensis]
MSVLASIWSKRNYRIAIIVTLVSALWLLSGGLFSSKENGQSGPAGEVTEKRKPDLRIRAQVVESQSYATRELVNGRTEANRSVRLRAELDGIIVALPVVEGRTVRKGEIICEIEAEDRLEQLKLADAAKRKAELDFVGAERLKKKGLQSDTAMAQQQVELARTRAEYIRAKVVVDNLKIRAPFDGVVNSRAVELGDFIRRGEECATLLDLDPILIVGEVSEAQVGNLITGGPASAQLQKGLSVEGRIRYISQRAQEITRSYRVEVAVENPGNQLPGGLSGQLALPTGEVSAHYIKASLLTLDDQGVLGVRILDRDHRVQFINVSLLGDGAGGVWISGLPDSVTLITVGQEYVSSGDLVRAEILPVGEEFSRERVPAQAVPEKSVDIVPVSETVVTPEGKQR